MPTKTGIHTGWYALCDFCCSLAAWFTFGWIRRLLLHQPFFHSTSFIINTGLLVAIAWLILFSITGSYRQALYRKSRLNELTQTIIIVFFGSVIITFLLLLNDTEKNNWYIYQVFFLLWFIQSFFTVTGRWFCLGIIKQKIITGQLVIPVVLVGNNAAAAKLYKEISKNFPFLGYKTIGYINTNESTGNLQNYLPCLGNTNQLLNIIDKHRIDMVMLALTPESDISKEQAAALLIEKDVAINIVPQTLDIIAGSVKTSNVFGATLIELNNDILPLWQQNLKRLLDVVVALISLLALSPLLLFVAIKTKLSSRGGILYTQERIGYKGKPFTIYKFRSMYSDAENMGPTLSSGDKDPRITPWGRIMRKWRLDELPQLWNIIKGDMSLVGPRPERSHFIEIVSAQNPFYKYLLRAKPGLTSWGMVQFMRVALQKF
jgi:polysaccharide biosynthesis protein PslA